jgi:hypothetical protein
MHDSRMDASLSAAVPEDCLVPSLLGYLAYEFGGPARSKYTPCALPAADTCPATKTSARPEASRTNLYQFPLIKTREPIFAFRWT